MKVMLFQPDTFGHHVTLYLRHIAREVLRRGWDFHLVTTRGVLDSPAFSTVASECGNRLRISFIPEESDPWKKPKRAKLLLFKFRRYRAFARAYSCWSGEQKPDVVLVEHLDRCDRPLALLGSPFGETPFVGLLMGPRFHHRRMGILGPGTRRDWFHAWLLRRLLQIPTLRSVLAIDESLVHYASEAELPGASKLLYLPDAASVSPRLSHDVARRRFGILSGQLVVLAYGVLAERKGVAELITALADPSCQPNVVALIAGSQDPFVQHLLSSELAQKLRSDGRLIEVPGFLDDAGQNAVFSAADVAWLGYRGFYGMSGVLVQSCAMGLPVVACREGVIGWLTRKHELGVAVDSTDIDQVILALNRLAKDPTLRGSCGENGRRMAERHDPSNFASTICDALAAAVPGGAGDCAADHTRRDGYPIA
jgi:glycosyltransferase involved in cell wall biosynthesis